MDSHHYVLGEAIADACAEGTNFVDWPGHTSRQEIRQLRDEGYHVAVNASGIHVRWRGTWWGDTSTDVWRDGRG